MRNITFLAFNGTQSLDLVGPMEVFSEANQFTRDRTSKGAKAYHLTCITAERENPVMSNGLSLGATHFSEASLDIHTLVLPGGSESGLEAVIGDKALMAWLDQACQRATRVVSICTGAFILASLGQLNGRQVCTHWSSCMRLQNFAPETIVDADSLFRRDGRFYTSAGVTSGIDLALALVEEDLGRQVASSIARHLVLYLRRPGGQSQFKQPLYAQHKAGDKVRQAIDYINNHLEHSMIVEDIAAAVGMSTRSFSRLIQSELSTSPGQFLRQQRLTIASSLLSEGNGDIKQVAKATGFSSAAVFANAFKRHFGLTPQEYRARFSSALITPPCS